MCPSNYGYQTAFFELTASEHVVNVASVPHRSPFRYPGGKTWLVPRIRQWLTSFENRPKLLLEPFAGGGIVGLTAAFEGLVEHVLLVEIDEQVAAVWQTILSGDAEWLAERILTFDLSIENVQAVLAEVPTEKRQIAFQTIVKNRTYHGGILAPGSSLIKNGENGRGIHSRWYAETISKRIRAIGKIRNRFSFVHGDGISVLQDHRTEKETVHFIDPPYTAGTSSSKRAGNRLYTHHALDHERLFATAQQMKGDILLTYDDSLEVVDLAKKYCFKFTNVAMKNTHHAKMTELLIGRDFSWLV